MAETAVLDRPKKATVQPFAVEADHPRNADLLLQSIPGLFRLRGAISAAKSVKDIKTGDERIPVDQARHLGALPPIPGMQLHLNPAALTYRIVDPLHEDEALCERIRRNLAASQTMRSDSQIKGVPPQVGKLDTHYMKTLCREVLRFVEAGEAKLVKGVLPTLEDIDELDGHYLLNPNSQIQYLQPRYEKDFEAWKDNLARTGG